MSIAKMMKSEFNNKDYSLSGIGGVETGSDAAEFILLGADTVQVGPKLMLLIGSFGDNNARLFIHAYLINFNFHTSVMVLNSQFL